MEVTVLEKTFRSPEKILEAIARHFVEKKIKRVFKNNIRQTTIMNFDIERFIESFPLIPNLTEIISRASLIFYKKKVPFLTPEELLKTPIIKKLRSVASPEFLEKFIQFDSEENILLDTGILFGRDNRYLRIDISEFENKIEVKTELEENIFRAFRMGFEYDRGWKLGSSKTPSINMGYVISPILKKLGPRFVNAINNSNGVFFGSVKIIKLEVGFAHDILNIYEKQIIIAKHTPLIQAAMRVPLNSFYGV
jgi:hypothetical protein